MRFKNGEIKCISNYTGLLILRDFNIFVIMLDFTLIV
jgi:hypothetical protein